MCVKSVSFGLTDSALKANWKQCDKHKQSKVSCFVFIKIISQSALTLEFSSHKNTHISCRSADMEMHREETHGRWKTLRNYRAVLHDLQ